MSFFLPRFCIIEFIVAIVNSFTKKNQKLYSADVIQKKKCSTKLIPGTKSSTNITVCNKKNRPLSIANQLSQKSRYYRFHVLQEKCLLKSFDKPKTLYQ